MQESFEESEGNLAAYCVAGVPVASCMRVVLRAVKHVAAAWLLGCASGDLVYLGHRRVRVQTCAWQRSTRRWCGRSDMQHGMWIADLYGRQRLYGANFGSSLPRCWSRTFLVYPDRWQQQSTQSRQCQCFLEWNAQAGIARVNMWVKPWRPGRYLLHGKDRSKDVAHMWPELRDGYAVWLGWKLLMSRFGVSEVEAILLFALRLRGAMCCGEAFAGNGAVWKMRWHGAVAGVSSVVCPGMIDDACCSQEMLAAAGWNQPQKEWVHVRMRFVGDSLVRKIVARQFTTAALPTASWGNWRSMSRPQTYRRFRGKSLDIEFDSCLCVCAHVTRERRQGDRRWKVLELAMLRPHVKGDQWPGLQAQKLISWDSC